jgi:hypothetical protein
LIVSEANRFKFDNNHELRKTNMLLARKFLRDLTEAGVELPGGFDDRDGCIAMTTKVHCRHVARFWLL